MINTTPRTRATVLALNPIFCSPFTNGGASMILICIKGQGQGVDKVQRQSVLKAFTAAAGPWGCAHTPAETARKSAPASTSGLAFPTVIPPIATHGTTINSLHQRRISGSAAAFGCLVWVG